MILVAAVSLNGYIGNDKNELPWHYPEDLKKFRLLTKGTTTVMGYRTFESLGSKPLAERNAIVITRRDPAYLPYHRRVQYVNDPIHVVNRDVNSNLSIIGGESVFAALGPFCHTIYLATIPEVVQNGKAKFPMQILDKFQLTRSMIKGDIQFSEYTKK